MGEAVRCCVICGTPIDPALPGVDESAECADCQTALQANDEERGLDGE